MNKTQAYFLLIFTFILILVWIVFSIIQSRVNSTISVPLTVQIAPINPSFDMQTIASLKKRIIVAPASEIPTETATAAAQQNQPTPTITQPVSSTSAIPSITVP
jgi:uncharacterized ParB-like nuclease family protein